MNSVLSFWNRTVDGTIDADTTNSLKDSQLRSLLEEFLADSVSLVSIVSCTGPQNVDGRPLILMHPSFMDTRNMPMTWNASHDEALVQLKKVTTTGEFPFVLFPIKISDSAWCVGMLDTHPKSGIPELVLVCSEFDQITPERVELIKEFTASLVSLLRIAPTTSLRVRKLRFEDTLFAAESRLVTILLIANIICDYSKQSSQFFTAIVNSKTDPTVEVTCTDYRKQFDTLVGSLGTGTFNGIPLSSNTQLRFIQDVQDFSNYTRNLDGDRLIFPESVLKLVEESGTVERFTRDFVDTTSVVEFISVQAKEDSKHVKLTDWLYALLTQFPTAVPVDEITNVQFNEFERLKFKKRDFIDFICAFSGIDPSLVFNELKSVGASRRLDRKISDARFHYVRSKRNPKLIWRVRPNKKGAHPSLSMIINPRDLINYCYYGHAVLTKHGSVKRSYDAVKHIDNVTRNMVWFVCAHCKECNNTSMPLTLTNRSGNITQPFQKLCIEVVESKKDDYKWILLVCDEYSQFIWLFPLKNKSYNSIRDTLMIFFNSNTFVHEEIQTSTLLTILSRFVKAELSGKAGISTDRHAPSSTVGILKEELEKLHSTDSQESWPVYLSLLSNQLNTNMRGGSLENTPVSLLFSHGRASKMPFRMT